MITTAQIDELKAKTATLEGAATAAKTATDNLAAAQAAKTSADGAVVATVNDLIAFTQSLLA